MAVPERSAQALGRAKSSPDRRAYSSTSPSSLADCISSSSLSVKYTAAAPLVAGLAGAGAVALAGAGAFGGATATSASASSSPEPEPSSASGSSAPSSSPGADSAGSAWARTAGFDSTRGGGIGIALSILSYSAFTRSNSQDRKSTRLNASHVKSSY